MKLHLPNGLRQALVASLAALASFVPTTLFSASALSGAALVSFSLVDQAKAITAQQTKDVTTHGGVVESGITYSGWIFTLDIAASQSQSGQGTRVEFPMYGGNANEVKTIYTRWLPNDAESEMQETALGNGRASVSPDGTAGQIWAFFSTQSNQNHYGQTLRLAGGHDGEVYNITTGFSTKDPYNLVFGGLIIEAGAGGYNVGDAGNNKETISLQAGSSNGEVVEFLVLSNLKFNTSGSGMTVQVKSNSNIRVGAGISMDWTRAVSVDANKTLALTKVGTGVDDAHHLMKSGLALNAGASLRVGSGVNLLLGGSSALAGNVEVLKGGTISVDGDGAAAALTGELSLACGGVLNAAGGTIDLSAVSSLNITGDAAEDGSALLVVNGMGFPSSLVLSDTLLTDSAKLQIAPILTTEIYEGTEEQRAAGLAGLISYAGDADLTPFLSSRYLRRGWTLGWSEGALTLTEQAGQTGPADLVWNDAENTVWDAGNEEWSSGEVADKFFHTRDNVFFSGQGADVSIGSSGVVGGNMQVTSGDYRFFGGALSLYGNLTVDSGASLTVTNQSSSVNGDVNVASGAHVAFHSGTTWTGTFTVGDGASGVALAGIMPLAETIDTDVTFGGTDSVGNGGGLVINSGARVTISSTGIKDFGSEGVVVNAGGVLRITNYTSWTTGAITGSGTLELDFGGPTNRNDIGTAWLFDTYIDSLFAESNSIMSAGEVKLVNNTLIQIGSSSDVPAYNRIKKLYVTNGSVLALRSNANNGFGDTTTTLYLEGHGLWDANSGTSGLVFGSEEVKGALALGLASAASTYRIAGNVELLADSSVFAASGKTTQMSGRLNANGHQFIKTGAGTLNLNGAFSTTGAAGSLVLEKGTLGFDYNASSQQSFASWSVSMLQGAVLSLNGAYDYEIATLTGAGSVSGSNKTLRLMNASGEFTGTVNSGATVAVASGTWSLSGAASIAGTVSLTGGQLDITGSTGTNNLPFDTTGALAVDVTAYGSGYAALKLTADQISNFATEISLLNYEVGVDLSVKLLDVTGLTIDDAETYFAAIIEHIDSRWLSRSQWYEISADGVLSIEGDPTDLVWSDGDGVWKEATELTQDQDPKKWLQDGDATYFGNGDNVTFGKDGATNTGAITVSGSVTAGNMHVAMGEWTLSPENDGSVAVNGTLAVDAGSKLILSSTPFSVHGISTIDGTLEVSGSGALTMTGAVTVGTGGTLTVGTSAAKSFAGGITVNGTGALKIANRTGWTNASFPTLNGDGVLKFAYGEMSSPLANSATFDSFDNVLWTKAGSGANPVYTTKGNLLASGSLKLADNTLLTTGSGSHKGIFEAIKKFYVESGSAFIFRVANNPFGNETTTLYLEGDGGYKHVYTGSPEGGESIKGALAIGFAGTEGRDTNNNLFTLAGNIELTNHASVYVQGGLGSAGTSVMHGVFTGALKGNGYTLTKTGLGELQLNGTFSTTGAASKIAVEAGTLVLGYTSGQALSGWSLDVTGTLNVSGTLQGGYEVRTLTGSGQVTGTTKLVISNSDTAAGTPAFSGTVAAGATVEVAQGVWSLDAATINGTVRMAGGTLDQTQVSSQPTLGAAGSLQVSVTSYGASATAYALKLTAEQIAAGDVAGLISFADFDFSEDDPSDFSVKLLDLNGLTVTDFSAFLANLDDNMLGRNQSFALSNGVLTIDGAQTELLWGGGSGTWTGETKDAHSSTAWDMVQGETNTYFENGENVTFGEQGGSDAGTINISGNVTAGKMTVVSGTWSFADVPPADENGEAVAGNLTVLGVLNATGGTARFSNASTTLNGDVTVGQGATLAFDAGTVSASGNVTIEAGGRMELKTAAAKTFAHGISVQADAVLSLSSLADLTGGITGAGTLELHLGGTEIGDNQLDSGVLGSFLNAPTTHTLFADGVVMLVDTYFFTGNSGSFARFNNIHTLYVKDGSTLGIRYTAATGYHGTSGTHKIYLEGNGNMVNNGQKLDGAILIGFRTGSTAASTYYINSDITLKKDASIYVEKASASQVHTGVLGGVLDTAGNTLTKNGGGVLNLSGAFSTVGTAGAIHATDGTLRLSYTNSAALANYLLELDSAATLDLYTADSSYEIGRLAGAGTVSSSATGCSLVIKNTESGVATVVSGADPEVTKETNVFSGTVGANVTVELTGGYQKLTGTLTGGSNYKASAGTLALAGTFGGAHSITAADATVDMQGATVSGAGVKLVLATTGTGVISNLSLGAGATLGVATAGATADAVESVVNLGGAAALAGGSILQFDVAEDTSGASWHTATKLQVSGSLDLSKASAESTIKVQVDPYARLADGKLALLSVGEHVLIAGAQLEAADLAKFAGSMAGVGLDAAAGGHHAGELKINERGDLVLDVASVPGLLEWDVAAGGDWSNDPEQNWHDMNQPAYKLAFEDGDAVFFSTLAGASEVTVTVTDDVKPGAITVTGETSYVLNGRIGGLDDGSGAGLVVGTADSPFTGTLTLTSANAWGGDNAINSGTVVARHAGALSTGATVLKGGVLQLSFAQAGVLSSALTLQGGTLTAVRNATADVSLLSGAMTAQTGATLTVRLSSIAADAVICTNSTTDSGTVQLQLPAGASAAELQVLGGKAVLDAAASSATLTTAVTVAPNATLSVSSGVTLAGSVQAEGKVIASADSCLDLSGAASRLNEVSSLGGTLRSEDSVSYMARLSVEGNTVLAGAAGWSVEQVSGAAGVLTVASGSAATVEAGSVGHVVVEGGAALRVGDLAVAALELSGASGSPAQLLSGVVTADVLTAAHAEVAAGVELVLSGSGSEVTDSALRGSITLRSAEADAAVADLTIGQGASLGGAVTIESGRAVLGSGVQIEAASVALQGDSAWLDLSGTAAAGLQVSLVGGGTLQRAEALAGEVRVDDLGSAASVFDLGGLGAEANLSLTLTAGSTVTGLGSGVTLSGSSVIALAAGKNLSADEAMLQSDAPELSLVQKGSLKLIVDDIYTEVRASRLGMTYYIFNTAVSGSDWSKDKVTFSASLLVYGMNAEFREDGGITFIYSPVSSGVVYVASEQEQAEGTLLSDYGDLDDYLGVVIDHETKVDLTEATLTEEYPDGLVMRNLTGTTRGTLEIEGAGSGASLVTIQNTLSEEQLAEYAEFNGLDIDNEFSVASDVHVKNADLQIKHQADNDDFLLGSRTVMTGELKIQGGDLLMTSGELELRAAADVEEVVFAGHDGMLVISAATAAVGNLTVGEPEPRVADDGTVHLEHVRLENGGVMVLKDGATVGDGLVIGNTEAVAQAAGTVSVAAHSAVSIAAATSLRHLVLQVEGELSILSPEAALARQAPASSAADAWTLAGLTGGGAVIGARDMGFSVAGSDREFAGSLAAYKGTMTFGSSSYVQRFAGVTGGRGWHVTNAAGGRVEFDLMKGAGASNTLSMGNLTLEDGSFTTIVMDLASAAPAGISVMQLTILSGADVTISQYQGTVSLAGEDGAEYVLGVIDPYDKASSEVQNGVHWHIKGVRNAGDVYVDPDDNVTIKVLIDNTNKYASVTDNQNSRTGAELLWHVADADRRGGDLASLDAALLEMVAGEGANEATRAEANRVLAAVAGAGNAVLGQAVSADIERQLRAVRNRTTTMGAGALGSADPFSVNAWLNAEADYHKHKADGMLPGYKTNGWGGTVGMMLEQNSGTTIGFALTAMYNNVEAESVDRVKGDMDTMYLSAFAVFTEGAWRHTFVGTAGRADVDVNRTVRYGDSSYTTHGSTEGVSFGLMYEVGYSLALNTEQTVCLQPVLNVAWRYNTLNAYSESGSNAALSVGEQTYNAVTLGLGARLQASLGANALNRLSIVEARALAKADLADRRGEAQVAFAEMGAVRGKVQSAEQSALGVELGVGITTPLGKQSSIFADVSTDLRQEQVEFNATVGYKMSF